MDLKNSDFFSNISSFEHKDLFQDPQVWKALEKIVPYLEAYSKKSNLDLVSKQAYLVNEEKIL